MYPYQTNRGQLTHDWFTMPQKAKRKNGDNGISGPVTYRPFRIISTDAFGEECSFRRQVGDANLLKGGNYSNDDNSFTKYFVCFLRSIQIILFYEKTANCLKIVVVL